MVWSIFIMPDGDVHFLHLNEYKLWFRKEFYGMEKPQMNGFLDNFFPVETSEMSC